MADNYGVNARVSIDVIGAKDLNNLNNALAKFATGEELTAKETQALERAMKSLAAAQVNNTAQTKQATAASKALDAAYRSDEQAAKAAAAATKAAADSTYRYNAATRASSDRVAAAEAKALADAKKAVAAEIKAEESALKAERAALDAAAASTQKYNAYVKASNARVAAAEDKALATAKREVAAESRAAAAALTAEAKAQKQAQDYAYGSYQSNIKASQAAENFTKNLSTERYALYDVATTFGVLSTAMLGFSTAVEAVGTSFEKNFASVERTSGAVGDQLGELRDQLVDISTTMPIAFGDVTDIATLGAQLGIAEENLGQFTKTVGEFAATTDVSVEAAATGFGRLAQLTKTPTSEINNLGSAIYQVGLNSVATESQILSVAQQIAVSGQLAGFSAEQVVALSGALASLGVQPEAARGSIMRIFNNITSAAAEGGDALDKFASIAGTTAQDFADTWRSDPQAAFNEFIKGLGTAGQDAAGLLKDVGINAIRDQRALQLLASNTEVYTKAQQDSSTAYVAGTALTKGFDVVATTLAAKLQVLGQTLLAVADAASNLGPLKAIVGSLQNLANLLKEFVGTPVGAVISTIVIAFTALAGVYAGVLAAQALLAASFLAMRTAMAGLNGSTATSLIGFKALTGQFALLALGEERATAGMTAYSTAVANGTGRLGAMTAAARAADVSLRGAAAAAGTFAKATLVGLGITALIMGVSNAVDALSNHYKTAEEKAKDYYGDLSGLASAMQKDTQAAADGTGVALRYVTGEIKTSSNTLAPWAEALQKASGAQVALDGSTRDTTETVKSQTIAIGESSKAWLANAIAQDANFRKAFQNNQAALSAAGFNLADYINRTLSDDGGGAKYLDELTQKVRTFDAETGGAANNSKALSGALSGVALQGNLSGDAFSSFGQKTANATKASVGLSDSATQTIQAIAGLQGAAEATDGAFSTMASTTDFARQVFEGANISVDDGTDAMDDYAASTTSAADSMNDLVNNQLGAINSVYALGGALATNGDSFSMYSASGRANLAALNDTITAVVTLAGGDSAQLSQYLSGIMSTLVAHGVNSVAELGVVGDRIASLVGDAGLDISNLGPIAQGVANTMGQGYTAGMTKAATATQATTDATKDLQKEVVTLSDYVKDLSSIADDAFDFRHGLQEAKDELDQQIADMKSDAKKEAKKDPISIQDIFDTKTSKRAGLDSILSAYRELVQDAADAKKAVRDANNDIKQAMASLSGLKADKSVLEYQLKIAIKYGDVLRAQEIQAELAQNAADQAKSTNDLADAQKAAAQAAQDQNKTLKGNSAAAVNNRNKVRNLQSEYVDYIQSLIDSGASQEEINKAVKQSKKDFESQAEALGYSKTELATYTSIFDTYTTKQGNATKATDDQTKASNKSAQAKRDDRKALNDLYKKYQDYITALVNSGASEADIQAAIAESKAQFKTLGTQLGYSQTDIDDTAKSFDDLKTVIQKTPKNVNVKLENDPAVRALKEWIAKKDTKNVNTKVGRAKGSPSYYSQGVEAGDDWARGWAAAQKWRKVKKYKDSSVPGGVKYSYDGTNFFFNKGGQVPEYHAGGGQVGVGPFQPKGSDTVPAMLTPREYVMQTKAVDYWGLPFMNAINNQQIPQTLSTGSPAAASAGARPTSMMVELSPTDRHLLAAAGNVTLLLNGKVVAAAGNEYNANNTTRNVA